MDRIKELAVEARRKGICQEWHDQLLRTKTVKELAEMYLKGIDFCLLNDYPSNDFIKRHFRGQTELFGIYLDEHISAQNKRKIVALGNCAGRIEVTGYGVSEIFLKHNSKLTVIVSDHAFVMVDIFDNANLRIIASGDAKVCINRYSGLIEAEQLDKAAIKIIEKHRKTY